MALTLRKGFSSRTATQVAAALARDGFYFRDEFEAGQNLGTFLLNGTGTHQTSTINTTGGRPGRERQNVSAAATPDRASYTRGPGAGILLFLGGGALYNEWEAFLTTLSNGVENTTCRLGLGVTFHGQVDLTDGCYFENDYGNHANSSNWFACNASASVRTKVDTGIAAIAGTFQRFRIEVDAAGANVMYKINDVVVATIATNVPVVGLNIGCHTVKQLGATARSCEFDYCEFSQTFSSRR